MSPRQIALVTATVLVGLAAGFFFADEVSVTRALADVDDTTYVATFRAINDTIHNAAFGIVFFGAAPAVITAIAMNRRSEPVVRWLIAAALFLVVLCLAITVGGNVPLNDELAGFTELDGDASVARDDFEADWNRLNLMRTVTAVAGFAALATAAVLTGGRNTSAARERTAASGPDEPPGVSGPGPQAARRQSRTMSLKASSTASRRSPGASIATGSMKSPMLKPPSYEIPVALQAVPATGPIEISSRTRAPEM